ncbi:MAG: metallophosphoesterase family protein [Deltaproteobacteria bacterium]|nr:metallophosphoesterase family protein [Deltaproteobacteria bacterium]
MDRCLWLLPFLAAASCGGPAPGSQDTIQDAVELPDRTGGLDVPADRSMPTDARELGEAGGEEPRIPACRPPVPRVLEGEPDGTFDLGPYLMHTTSDSAVVMWRTLEPADGAVAWRHGSGPETTVEHAGSATVHEVLLAELPPDTDITYRVTSGGVVSGEHVFRTAPGPEASSRFIAWGDNQHGFETFAASQPGFLADGPHFLVGVGDHVQEGKVPEQWKDQLFDPARALFHQVPFFAAIGNHEDNAGDWYALNSHPFPAGDPDHETFYSYSWGNAFFLVIDVLKLPCPFGEVDTPQSAWIREAATSPEAQAATWRIAYGHYPAISESWGDGDCSYEGTPCLRDWVLPFLAEQGFHLYMAGHTHAYERGEVAGMLHVIVGGGGGGLDAWCVDFPEVDVVHTEHHHARVDLGCETLRLEGVDLDGKVFDWVEIGPGTPVEILDQGPADWLPPPTLNSDR